MQTPNVFSQFNSYNKFISFISTNVAYEHVDEMECSILRMDQQQKKTKLYAEKRMRGEKKRLAMPKLISNCIVCKSQHVQIECRVVYSALDT